MNNTDFNTNELRFVIKRSGDKVPFEEDKIKNAILKAMSSSGNVDVEMAEKIARLTKKGVFRNNKINTPHVDEIHDMVENKLMDNGLNDVAKGNINQTSSQKELI
jgi:ribonucleoside-triphosphate reductase